MILLFTILTVAAIVAQLPHAWYTFDSFSRLEGLLKNLQSITFCLIISVAIFAFVMLGKPMLALFLFNGVARLAQCLTPQCQAH